LIKKIKGIYREPMRSLTSKVLTPSCITNGGMARNGAIGRISEEISYQFQKQSHGDEIGSTSWEKVPKRPCITAIGTARNGTIGRTWVDS
jgi:hypothetical protein